MGFFGLALFLFLTLDFDQGSPSSAAFSSSQNIEVLNIFFTYLSGFHFFPLTSCFLNLLNKMNLTDYLWDGYKADARENKI